MIGNQKINSKLQNQIFEHIQTGLTIIELDGTINWVNNKQIELYGCKNQSEVITHNYLEFIQEKDKEESINQFKKCVEFGTDINREITIVTVDGEIRYAEESAFLGTDDNGNSLYIISIMRDITEWKKTEKSLLTNLQRNRTLINAIPDMMFRIDRDGRFLDYKAKPEDRLIVPPEFFLGKKIEEVLPQVGEQVLYELEKAFQAKALGTFEYHLTIDGKLYYYEARVEPISEENEAIFIVRDITEQKESEQTIKRLSLAIAQTADTVFVTDKNGLIEYVNSSLENIYGYTKDELIGQNPRIFKSGIKDNDFYNNLWKTILNGNEFRAEVINKTKNGTYVYEDRSITPIKDETGTVRHFLSVGRDITSRKLSEVRQAKAERKYSDILQTAFDGFMIIGENGNIKEVNDSYCRMSGYSREELLKLSINDLLDSDGRNEILLHMKRVLEKGRDQFESTHIRKDGSRFNIESSLMINESDGTNIIGFIKDITERKHAEDILKESEERFRMVFENAFIGISIFEENPDPSKRKLIECNEQYANIAGRKREELLAFGNPLAYQKALDVSANKKRLAALPTQNEFSGSFAWVRPDGKENIIEYVGKPITWRGKMYTIGIDRDVTKSIKAEEEIFRLNRIHVFISQINQMIVRAKDWEQIFINSCRIAIEYGMFRMAWIGLIDEEEQIVKPVVWDGFEDGYLSIMKPISVKDVPEGRGPTGMAIREGKSFCLNNIDESSIITPWRDEILKRGYHSSLSIPLFIDKKVIGAFSIYASEPNFFSELEIKMLEEVTDNISFALEMLDNEKKRLEAEKSLHIKDKAIESSINAIAISDLQGILTYVNPSFLHMWSYENVTEVIGKSVNEFWDAKERAEEVASAVLTNRKWIGEMSAKKKDGSIFFTQISASLILDDSGIPLYLMGAFVDITEKLEAERKINLLAHALESISECVSITDTNDIILYVNNSFLNTYGYSEEELVGKHVSLLRSSSLMNEHVREILTETIEGGWRGELINKRKNGELFPILLSTSIIKNDNGKSIALIGVAIDISEMKKNREELIKAKEKAEEMSRIKSNFLANMSHELRTPLIGIIGYAEIMNDSANSPEIKEMAEIIFYSGQRLMRTLNMILDLSKIEANKEEIKIEEFDALEVIKNCLKLFEKIVSAKKLEMKLKSSVQHMEVTSDRRIFESIINNLVNNAIKFTLEGSVTVSISEKNLDYENKNLCIEVSDTGIGMSEDAAKVIFDEFRQASEGMSRSHEGTGLGLTLTKKYVEILHGKISLETKLGEGSKFIIELPVASSSTSEISYIENKSQVAEDTKTNLSTDLPNILMIDDDRIACDVCRNYLKSITKLDSANNYEEAIEKISSKQYQIILLDINLGEHKNGIDLFKELKLIPNYKNVPIVACTAYAMTGDMEIFLSEGFDSYISKPFHRKELINLVNSLIKT